MNKKLLLITLLVGVMAVTLVSAIGLMVFYGQVNTNVPVNQPISVLVGDEDITGNVFTETLEQIDAGEMVTGASIEISNSADEPKSVVISEYYTPEGIEVDYGWIICGQFTSLGEEGTLLNVPAGSSCVFSIDYQTDVMLTTGNYVVKTQINPVSA